MTIHRNSTGDRASDQAKNWLMKVKSGSMTARDRKNHRTWLATDPVNQAEFDLMNAVWDCSDVFKDHPLAIEDLKENQGKRPAGLMIRWRDSLTTGIPAIRPVAVAAIAVIVVLGILLSRTDKTASATYQTIIGQQKTVLLSDGSTIDLDTNTIISTRFSGGSRAIELKRGHAFFSVSHDAARPFIVSAGQTVIRALGTEFDVHKINGSRITIAVLQGRVQVDSHPVFWKPVKKSPAQTGKTKPDKKEAALARRSANGALVAQAILGKGEEIFVDVRKMTHEIRSADVDRINAWRKGRLYFKMKPLSRVIDELNRYLDQEILIVDETLKDIPITMNFDIRARRHFIRTLVSAVPGIEQTTGHGKILLARRKE